MYPAAYGSSGATAAPLEPGEPLMRSCDEVSGEAVCEVSGEVSTGGGGRGGGGGGEWPPSRPGRHVAPG